MAKVLLVGLSGKKRSGKDTVFQMIQKAGVPALRFGFADPLKEEMAWACNVSRDFIEENKDKFRLGLQWWGSEFRRGLYGDDYWIKKMEKHVAEEKQLLEQLHDTKLAFIVITDVRFPNEFDYVRNSGGIMVRVERDTEETQSDPHPSETALDNHEFDFTISNRLTFAELEEQVSRVIQNIQSKYA